MRVGFIGLGAMGLHMCTNLARSFEQVLAYDASDAARTSARDNGVYVVPLVDHLQDLDVLVTMLPDGGIVRECLLGKEGARAPVEHMMRKGGVVVDMSSSSPLDSQRLAADLAHFGLSFSDAPVSGSVPKAKSATLAIMVGASEEVYLKIEPVLRAMGTELIRTGDVGTAHTMKTLNNYVYAAGLLAATEAMMIGERMGLDLDRLVDVFNSSSGRNVATETKLRQHMIKDGQLGEGDLKGGFGLHLMAKDLGIGSGLKERTGFAPEQIAQCHRIWQDAAQALPKGADNLEILSYLRERYSSEQGA